MSANEGEFLMRHRFRPAAVAALLGALATLLPGSARADGSLVGTVGPGFSISLAGSDNAPVTHLDPGTYTILVHDLASIHNFHLTGPGVNVKTSVSGTGTKTFTVTLKKGTYKFVCDPHASVMKGSFKVS
jgi:hypothetical protein